MRDNLVAVVSVGAGYKDVGSTGKSRNAGLQGQFGLFVMWHVVFVWQVVQSVAVVRRRRMVVISVV